MKQIEVEGLKILLNTYFDKEFEMYRKSYQLVYGERNIEDDNPENLFMDVITTNHPYQNFLQKMRDDIMDHILRVFILEDEPNRFEDEN